MEPLPISLAVFALALVVGTVLIHSVGSFLLLWGSVKFQARSSSLSTSIRLTVGVTIRVLALLLLHMLEVALWAALFYREGCFPDFRTSIYFSLITYSTVGYGDVVLNVQYRMLGGIEALVGILMLSWSTAILIGYLQRIYSPLRDRLKGIHRDT
jgi:voltage-gated potassium channel